MSPQRQPRPAFSMLEVLIVLGLIALLLAFLFPALRQVRSAAARTQGTNNLRQMAIACHAFHDTRKKLPINGVAGQMASPDQAGSGSWAYQILPFVEQEPAFRNPKAIMEARIPVYMCPSRGRPGFTTEGKLKGPVTDYAVNCWINERKNGSLSAADRPTQMAGITDGTSNTIMIGQLALRPGDYMAKDAAEGRESFLFGGTAGTGRNGFKHVLDGPDSDPSLFGGPFGGGTLFALADGSVRVIALSVNLRPILTPDGNEVVGID
jgi:prepilin-type N-terminal cleavage/methylation domain-containing protein